jgi:hypothetical protein
MVHWHCPFVHGTVSKAAGTEAAAVDGTANKGGTDGSTAGKADTDLDNSAGRLTNG